MIETAHTLFLSFFAADSIWSLIFRAVVWLAVAIIVIVSMDATNPDKASSSLRSNLAFFLLFLTLSCGLMFMLFSFSGRST